MDKYRMDDLAKRLGQGADRRKVLGGLALGSLGALGLTRVASAQVSADDKRDKCIDRCLDHAPKAKRARDRCRRKCENR